MNSLQARITEIQSTKQLSLVTLQSERIYLKSIVIDTPESCDYLVVGKTINVIFKEMEVSIATENNLPMSQQNEIPGEIISLEKKELLAKIRLKTKVGEITSVITSASAERLKLSKGLQVYALIKTNELMLSLG